MANDDSWIQTYTGLKVYPLDPKPEYFVIEDIAHALSLTNRFCGHTNEPYSVAEHSFRVSELLGDGMLGLYGLLHDASEAYLNDIPRPVKHHPDFAFYREAEARLMRVICQKFGLPEEEPAAIKTADMMMLVTEARDLRGPLHPEWKFAESKGYRAHPTKIVPWSWDKAETKFLAKYYVLTTD